MWTFFWVRYALLCLMLAGAGCTQLSAWHPRQKPVAGRRSPVVSHNAQHPEPDKPAIALETRAPALQLAKAASPQRTAAEQVVALGLDALRQQQWPRALQHFQEAVTIDGNNGSAYYYMARTYFALRQPERVEGLLDRAETLLADDERWLQKIAEFRRQLEQAI